MRTLVRLRSKQVDQSFTSYHKNIIPLGFLKFVFCPPCFQPEGKVRIVPHLNTVCMSLVQLHRASHFATSRTSIKVMSFVIRTAGRRDYSKNCSFCVGGGRGLIRAFTVPTISGPTCFFPMMPVRIPCCCNSSGRLLTASNELKWCTLWCRPYMPFWCCGRPGKHKHQALRATWH